MTTYTRWMKNLAVASLAIPAAAAFAANTPTTIVVLHRNIQNTHDEENWLKLARGLSADGFRVVSVAVKPAESVEASRTELIKLLDETGYNDKVVLVGTSSVSETITSVAQSEPSRVKALVYVSATDAVPSFGPRNVNVPARLTGMIPTYQVKVTAGKAKTARTEGGTTIFRVREEGKSTLGRTDEMISTIETVNSIAKPLTQTTSALATR